MCVKPFIDDCSLKDGLAWDVVDGLYEYLCGVGFDGKILSHV